MLPGCFGVWWRNGRLKNIRKFPYITCGTFFGLPLVVLIGLFVVWNISNSVGYLNLTVNLWSLNKQAELALEYPVAPGRVALTEYEGDQLVERRYGRVAILGSDDDTRVVIFDRGGGHLGMRGYVYAPGAQDTDQVHQDAFEGFEGRSVRHLYGDWWAYKSVED